MKTLRAFWHWVDNDKPSRITRDKLSEVALSALLHAESEVAARAFGGGSVGASWMEIWTMCLSSDGTDPNARPEFFRPELVQAVRDLSLAICPALEAMHAAVPEPVPVGKGYVIGVDLGKEPGVAVAFQREYLGEWLPAAAGGDTFFGVDRSRDEDRPLSGVRVPQSFNLSRASLRGDISQEPRVDCFHCDQSFPESQIDQHGKECRQRSLDNFRGLVAPGSAISVETQQALQQRDDYQLRAANYLASVVPPGTVSPQQREAQQQRLRDRNLGYEQLVIHLAPSMSRHDCDSFRGLRPNHIIVKGNAAACPVWEYLRDEVLVPMTMDGATIEKR